MLPIPVTKGAMTLKSASCHPGAAQTSAALAGRRLRRRRRSAHARVCKAPPKDGRTRRSRPRASGDATSSRGDVSANTRAGSRGTASNPGGPTSARAVAASSAASAASAASLAAAREEAAVDVAAAAAAPLPPLTTAEAPSTATAATATSAAALGSAAATVTSDSAAAEAAVTCVVVGGGGGLTMAAGGCCCWGGWAVLEVAAVTMSPSLMSSARAWSRPGTGACPCA